MYSTGAWILVCLALFFFPSGLYLAKFFPISYSLILTAVVASLLHQAHAGIPTAAFWFIIVLLAAQAAPLALIILLFSLVSWVADLDSAAFAAFFWSWVVLLPCLLWWLSDAVSLPFCACWLATAVLLRGTIALDMPPSWWLAWAFFFIGLRATMSRHIPYLLSAFWVVVLAFLGQVMDSHASAGQFASRTLVIYAIRALLHPLYSLFSSKTEALFPLNVFLARWKLSPDVWHPVAGLLDGTTQITLCDRCATWTGNSRLIMGSRWPITGLAEWHDFGQTLDHFRRSRGRDSQPCQVCRLLWHYVDRVAGLQSLESGNAASCGSEPPPLRVKVWEVRPLTGYTYVQLYHGDMPIGTHLVVHRSQPDSDDPYVPPSCRDGWTGSASHMAQAEQWLRECKAWHTSCNDVGTGQRELPTRLLDISQFDPSNPQSAVVLRVTSDADRDVRYLAFSHCWGGEVACKLLESNLHLFVETGVPWAALSKNMQDAVAITHHLGYSLVWIDSMCIVQDSPADWAREAPRMGHVYAGADCTIASTGSSSSAGGCFHERDCASLRPCLIGVSSPHELLPRCMYARRDDLVDFEHGVNRSPLGHRAWVLQERLLSRRVLHFGAEMIYWECREKSATETQPEGYVLFEPGTSPGGRRPPGPAFDRERDKRRSGQAQVGDLSNFGPRVAFETLRSNKKSITDFEFSRAWYSIAEPYTRARLTEPRDRLMALSSVVEEIRRSGRNAVAARYVDGLWMRALPYSLLWFASPGPAPRKLPAQQPSMSSKYAIPSWSWVVVDGAVAVDFPSNRSLWTLGYEVLAECTAWDQDDDVGGQDGLAFELAPDAPTRRLYVTGPLVAVTAVGLDPDTSTCCVYVDDPPKRCGRILLDVACDWRTLDRQDLACLSCLELRNAASDTALGWRGETQGLVLRLVSWDVDTDPVRGVYERVGFFTTRIGDAKPLDILRNGAKRNIIIR